MRPQHQPYRKHDRQPGGALTAMLAGKPTFLANPAVLTQQRLKMLAEMVRRNAR